MKKKFGNTATIEPEATEPPKPEFVKTPPAAAADRIGPPMKRADLPLISTLPKKHMLAMQEAFDELEMHTYFIDESGRLMPRKDRVEELKKQIEQIQDFARAPGFRHGQLFFTSKYYTGKRNLDRGKLLENGVTAQQIADSFTVGKGSVRKTFGRLDEADEKEGEKEGGE